MTKVFVISNNDISSLESLSTSPSISPMNLDKTSQEEGKNNIISCSISIEAVSTQQELQGIESFDQEISEITVIERESSQSHTISRVDACLENELEDDKNSSFNPDDAWNKEKACKRNEMFKSIILNSSTNFSWAKLLSYTLGTSLIGFLATAPYSIIPFHDIIQYQKHWYEILIHGPYMVFWGYAFKCLLGGFFMNVRYLHLDRIVFLQSVIGFTEIFLLLITMYFIWTHILDYNFPVPFMGYTVYVFNNVSNFMAIWLIISKERRHGGELKKKMKYYILLFCVMLLGNTSYEFIVVVLRRCPSNYQPIFALALPILREACIWTAIKLARKPAKFDLRGATIALKYGFSVAHTLILCNTIGTIATETTSWLLIAVDFFLNIYLAIRLVWLKKRQPYKIQEQIDVLQDLALYELVEFLASASFLLVLGLTYFGPNGNLFGNIRRSIWTFTAIEDINETLINIGKFFAVDFSSTIICAIILRVYCQINLSNVFLQLQKEFGKYFVITLSRYLIVVSISTS